MRSAVHVACMEVMRNTYKFLAKKPEIKVHLEFQEVDGNTILKRVSSK
jgi:ADP-dependent phosphofructokinase/glucokinase